EVSRQMWGWLWPGLPVERVPIRYITNGIHTASWLSLDLREAFDRYLGSDWYKRLDEPGTWDGLAALPNEALWAIHNAQRLALVTLMRQHVQARGERLRLDGAMPGAYNTLFDLQLLTIGFARRFATYKRATLIFRDVERLKRLLNDPQRPMQIIFSGK